MTLFVLNRTLSESFPDLRHWLSSCLLHLSFNKLDVNQGFKVRGVTVTVFRDVYLSKIDDRVELK